MVTGQQGDGQDGGVLQQVNQGYVQSSMGHSQEVLVTPDRSCAPKKNISTEVYELHQKHREIKQEIIEKFVKLGQR